MADKIASTKPAAMGAPTGGPVTPGFGQKPKELPTESQGTFNGLNVKGKPEPTGMGSKKGY